MPLTTALLFEAFFLSVGDEAGHVVQFTNQNSEKTGRYINDVRSFVKKKEKKERKRSYTISVR